jgi:hypothetical protein
MTSCVHKMCGRTYGQTNMNRAWSEHVHIMPISRMVEFCESCSPFHVCLTIRPSAHLVYATSHLSFAQNSTIREIGIICTCSDHGQPRYQIWIKCHKRQMTSCAHKMCERTYPWSEHVHIILISRMVDFCETYSPIHVCLTIRPSAHLVYATSHLSFVAFYSYLVSWLTMIWACAYYVDFMDCWFLREL